MANEKELLVVAPCGCLTGGTKINFNRGGKGFSISLEHAYKSFNVLHRKNNHNWDKTIQTYVRSFNGKRIQLHPIKDIVFSGEKPVYKMVLENGLHLTGTKEHKIMTNEGWIELFKCKDKLVMCDNKKATKSKSIRNPKVADKRIGGLKFHPYARTQDEGTSRETKLVEIHRLIYEAKINKMDYDLFLLIIRTNKVKAATLKYINPSKFHIHHKDGNHFNNEFSNLEALTVNAHRKKHGNEAILNFNQGMPTHSKCISVEYVGIEKTYDIICKDPLRNFVANGMVVHNSGKTILFSYLAQQISNRKKSIIIVVDSINLVLQTKEKMKNFVNASEIDVCCGTLGEKSFTKKIVIGTIQTLKGIELPSCDYLIFDEVHDGLSRIEKFAKREQFKDAVKIGFTATPFHAIGVAMYGRDKFFKKITYRCSPKELVEQGFLVRTIYHEQPDESKIDLTDVKINNFGDYSESDLQQTYSDNFQKVELQIKNMVKLCEGRKKIVVMCTGIHHANFVKMNLESAVLFHSEINHFERFENLQKFRDGKAKYLIGVSAIYKGLDVPEIDCLVMMRPTRSYPFYIQFVGRGSRIVDGKKNCLFLDFGNVVNELGFYDEFKEFNSKKETSKKKKQYPKTCDKCGCLNSQSAKFCIECSEIFVSDKELKKVERVNLEPDIKNLYPKWVNVMSYEIKKDIVSKNGNSMDILKVNTSLFDSMTFYFLHKFNVKPEIKNETKKILVDRQNNYFRILKYD